MIFRVTFLTVLTRIVLPLTTEEYRVGQLYSVAKSCQLETKGDSGVEVLKNEEYDNESGKGQYTSKVYHLGRCERMQQCLAALCALTRGHTM